MSKLQNEPNPNTDASNLQGGPDLDTVRTHEPKIVDEADGRTDNRSHDNPRLADDRSGAPFPTEPPDPSAEDPFVAGAPDVPGGIESDQHAIATLDDGPSYERDQRPVDDNTGGSSDPTNSLSHSDSGRPEQ